nr:uncharacterized protein LOC124806098 [Hydra vulgaris]
MQKKIVAMLSTKKYICVVIQGVRPHASPEKACIGHQVVCIQTVDTNVVAISISVFKQLTGIKQLWIEFGVGKLKRWLPIHYYAQKIGEKAEAVSLWFAFTGCDTVSSFAGRGKNLHGISGTMEMKKLLVHFAACHLQALELFHLIHF